MKPLLTVFSLLLAVFFAVGPASAMDLAGLFDGLEERNLQLRRARIQIEEAGLDVKIAENAFHPDASLRLSDTSKTFLDNYQKSAPGLINRTRVYSLNVEQSFPALGKTNRVKLAVENLRKRIRETELSGVRQDLHRDLITYFFKLVREEELGKIHAENLRLLQKLHEVASINLHVGLALKNDLLRIEVQQAQIETSAVESRNLAGNLRVDLAHLLNFEDPASLTITLPETLAFPVASPTLREAQIQVQERDPELAVARLDVETIKQTLFGAKKSRLPTVSLLGNYGYGDKIGPVSGTQDYSVTVSLNAPIFDSGDLRNEVRRAQKRLAMAELSLDERVLEKASEIRKALADYEEVALRIRFAQKAVEQSRENMRVVLTRYQAGDTSIVDLVDAQITLTDTAEKLLKTQYDERIRLAEILLLTNKTENLRNHDKGFLPPTASPFQIVP